MTDSPGSPESQPIVAATKLPLVSMKFIVIVSVLALGAYFGGPWIMTMVMYSMPVSTEAKKADVPVVEHPNLPAGFPAGGGDGGAGGGQRGGGGGGFDPEAFFAERDADSNGKLEGDEISGRMQERLTTIDVDGDGAVTKEEFLAGMQNRGGRGGRGGERPEGGGRPEGERPASESYEVTSPDSAAADGNTTPDEQQ